IPIGKLSLYTAIGGIRPERTLPIVLDVGTNNTERLEDPEYLGWRHERVTGQAYYDFVDQFVQAVKQELPKVCLQCEVFATRHGRPSALGPDGSRARAARLCAAARTRRELAAHLSRRDRTGGRDRPDRGNGPDRPFHRGWCVHRADRPRDGPQDGPARDLSAL